jgi:hypothetical protein
MPGEGVGRANGAAVENNDHDVVVWRLDEHI